MLSIAVADHVPVALSDVDAVADAEHDGFLDGDSEFDGNVLPIGASDAISVDDADAVAVNYSVCDHVRDQHAIGVGVAQ